MGWGRPTVDAFPKISTARMTFQIVNQKFAPRSRRFPIIPSPVFLNRSQYFRPENLSGTANPFPGETLVPISPHRV